MRLTIHAKIEVSAVMLLLLASCNSSGNQFSDKERDEIEDLAGDIAYDTVLEHEKVTNLESRVSEIESRLNM